MSLLLQQIYEKYFQFFLFEGDEVYWKYMDVINLKKGNELDMGLLLCF